MDERIWKVLSCLPKEDKELIDLYIDHKVQGYKFIAVSVTLISTILLFALYNSRLPSCPEEKECPDIQCPDPVDAIFDLKYRRDDYGQWTYQSFRYSCMKTNGAVSCFLVEPR